MIQGSTDVVFLVLSVVTSNPLQFGHRLAMRVVTDAGAGDDEVSVTTNVPD